MFARQGKTRFCFEVIAEEPKRTCDDARAAEDKNIELGQRHLHHGPIDAPKQDDGNEEKEFAARKQGVDSS